MAIVKGFWHDLSQSHHFQYSLAALIAFGATVGVLTQLPHSAEWKEMNAGFALFGLVSLAVGVGILLNVKDQRKRYYWFMRGMLSAILISLAANFLGAVLKTAI